MEFKLNDIDINDIDIKNILHIKKIELIRCSDKNNILECFENLEELILKYCDEINISNKLIKLTKIYLLQTNINKIPTSLINLKEITLNNCNNIKELPKNLTKNIIKLEIHNCKNIIDINYLFYNLKELIISCDYLNNLPEQLDNLKYLKIINSNIKEINIYSNLEYLEISNCYFIKEIPKELYNLKTLIINNCENIIYIPDTFYKLNNLKISRCYNLNELNIYSNFLTNLDLSYLNIKKLPNNLMNLLNLKLEECNNILELPNLFQLKKLEISFCKNIKELSITLINLENLDLICCPNISNIPNTLINLKLLKIFSCEKLKDIPKNIKIIN